MSTTVRIRPEDKARLDRLQAKYQLKRGKRVALDVLLGRMLEVAARHEDEVLEAYGAPPLTEEQKRRLFSIAIDTGRETAEETIDEELYGARLH